MIGILLVALSLLLLMVYLIWEQWKHKTCVSGIPGPPAKPLLGNALKFKGANTDNLVDFVAALQDYYGTPCKFWLGPFLFVIVAEPEQLEVILKSSENIKKSEVYYFFKDFLKGAFTSDGKKWVKNRKIVNSMLMSSHKFDQIVVINEKSRSLMKILDMYADSQTIICLRDLVESCILSIVTKTATGVDLEIGDKDGIEFMKQNRQCIDISMHRIIKAWLHPEIIFRNSSPGKKKQELIKNIISFNQSIMSRRREILSAKINGGIETVGTERTYLDQLFDFAIKEKISENDLALVINEVLIAGTDTTSNTASHTLTMLGMHQDILDKVYAEIQSVFGDSDRDATLEDLNKLTQLDMAIKESLRIICPPHLARSLVTEVKLCNDVIPAGTNVCMSIHRMHRDPRFWEYPDSYYPDHFLPDKVEMRPKCAYIPFSYGLRICPGRKFSSYIVKTVISTILRRYHITCDLKPSDLKYSLKFVLELNSGYPVRLHKRTVN